MSVSVSVSGLREIDAQLAELGGKPGTRVLRVAMLRAAKPILEQAKANAQARERGSGALHKSLGMRFVVGSRDVAANAVPPMGGVFRVEITPFRKDRTAVALYNMFYKRRIPRVFYGHLLEFGFTSRSGERVSASPFLKPALDSRGAEAISIFAREMTTGIERELKRKVRRSTKNLKVLT